MSEQERLLRVTEFCERSFTTKPHLRVGRGHTITIRRIYGVAKFLWDTNRRDRVTREDLENAIFYCVGADHRTINRYIGRWLFSKAVVKNGVIVEPSRKIKYVKGYMERLKFLVPASGGTWELLWAVIPPHILNGDASGTIPNLCAWQGDDSSHKTVMETNVRQHLPATKTINKQQHNTHTKQLNESILSTYSKSQMTAIQEVTPSKKAEIEACDRKRLATIEEVYLKSREKRSAHQI